MRIASPLMVPEFQSTSPVWGMTCSRISSSIIIAMFQSTSPVWGMTGMADGLQQQIKVSIHIPRVGDDAKAFAETHTTFGFNPHPPCGG